MKSHVDWQRIETAPRDGHRLLLASRDAGWIIIGYWSNDGDGGWCYDVPPLDRAMERDNPPTHWVALMPLLANLRAMKKG